MPIRTSIGAEIRPLLAALDSADAVTRESAVARLTVMAPRALDALLHAYEAAAPRVQAGILRALEPGASPRLLPLARAAVESSAAEVQAAAVGALRVLVGTDNAVAARDAFDALVSVALDRGRCGALRVAAWDAIREVAGEAREAVRAALATDPDPDVRAAADGGVPATDAGADVWRDASEGRLPAAPAALKTALAAHKTTARLIDLQRVVDHVRAREQQEADAGVREAWRAVRGAVHQALAARNSRLALYDLRDSFLTSERLPVAFLAAIEEIGDASCLEALAAAYGESSRSGDAWWREHLATAFRAIVQREGLTRRHAVVKRVVARWPDATIELLR